MSDQHVVPDPDWYPEEDERPTTGLRLRRTKDGKYHILEQQWVCRKGDKTWKEWRPLPQVTE